MKRGHIPLRRCVGCRRVRPQAELLRLVRDEQGKWALDPARRAPGRGSWVCEDTPACWTPKRLGRSYRAQTEAICRSLNDQFSTHTNDHELDQRTKPDRRA